jgi:predicted transposase YbfD/YdcC
MQLSETFMTHFEPLNDPRTVTANKRHSLHDVVVVTILATICGADNWVEVCQFARSKLDWLKTFLELPNGVPSHDTFGRIFSLIEPKEFEVCFQSWIESLNLDLKHTTIAIDGKTLRGTASSFSKNRPLHFVSAWSSEYRLVLGQIKTDEKSNEIHAIPDLLNLIDIEGSIVTIDAMGCQKSIASKIIEQEGDYVLNLKANHPKLFEFASAFFQMGEHHQFKKVLNRRVVHKDKDHGRIEKRRFTLISPRDKLGFELQWPGLRSIGMIEVTKTLHAGTKHQKVETSKRYFLTSLEYDQIEDFAKAVRNHWDVEIGLHWTLDVCFGEDHCQLRKGYAPANMATIRKVALNLLKQEQTVKAGIKAKRKRAGWDNDYLIKVVRTAKDQK